MAKLGRPPAENPRTRMHAVRLSDSEDALVLEAAANAGMLPAVWIREQALKAAKRRR